MITKKNNVSKLCNRLADLHDLNVTKSRDIVEDLRRTIFDVTRSKRDDYGLDIYAVLKGLPSWWMPKLKGGSRKPVNPAPKKRAAK